jgi:hypothetical protein
VILIVNTNIGTRALSRTSVSKVCHRGQTAAMTEGGAGPGWIGPEVTTVPPFITAQVKDDYLKRRHSDRLPRQLPLLSPFYESSSYHLSLVKQDVLRGT